MVACGLAGTFKEWGTFLPQVLHHPNIVMLMGMCTKSPWVSVVMEFLGKPAKVMRPSVS